MDWVEADIWWHYGQLHARHEHALWRLPVRYDEWKLALALRRPLSLEEILDRLTEGPRLLIDFKGRNPSLASDVVSLIRQRRAVDRVAICGQPWPLLDSAAEMKASIPVFYSLESEAQLDALRRRPSDPPIRSVSCAESLLTEPVLQELGERQIEVFAWTVNDRSRALELVNSGVAGIISDRFDVLEAVAGAV